MPSENSPESERRQAMVREQLAPRGITDRQLLAAMGSVPRHRFVPPDLASHAYEDGPLPIGHGQTISQPYVVARMIQLAAAAPGQRALDVGCGSGYQAAVLAEIVDEVYAVERVPELARDAAQRLQELGVNNVHIREGDGWDGWPEAAPFDIVLVGCADDEIPPPLIAQLATGGRLVMPVGSRAVQRLVVVHKGGEAASEEHRYDAVAFVPLLRVPR